MLTIKTNLFWIWTVMWWDFIRNSFISKKDQGEFDFWRYEPFKGEVCNFSATKLHNTGDFQNFWWNLLPLKEPIKFQQSHIQLYLKWQVAVKNDHMFIWDYTHTRTLPYSLHINDDSDGHLFCSCILYTLKHNVNLD